MTSQTLYAVRTCIHGNGSGSQLGHCTTVYLGIVPASVITHGSEMFRHPAGESQASDHPNSNADDDGDHHKATPGTCLQSTQESTLDSRSLSFVFGPEPKFLLIL